MSVSSCSRFPVRFSDPKHVDGSEPSLARIKNVFHDPARTYGKSSHFLAMQLNGEHPCLRSTTILKWTGDGQA